MSDQRSDQETTKISGPRTMSAVPADLMKHYVYLVQCTDGTFYLIAGVLRP